MAYPLNQFHPMQADYLRGCYMLLVSSVSWVSWQLRFQVHSFTHWLCDVLSEIPIFIHIILPSIFWNLVRSLHHLPWSCFHWDSKTSTVWIMLPAQDRGCPPWTSAESVFVCFKLTLWNTPLCSLQTRNHYWHYQLDFLLSNEFEIFT